ncbi:MAG: UDP-N-acetylmuramoyl-tripeptide--D-alanyl-D-alanine ligase [Planctomycetota bacterium]
MDPLTFAILKNAMKAETNATDLEQTVAGVSTDSRTVKPGELFVAIKGDRFRGEDYVADAFVKGAKAAVVEHWPAEARSLDAVPAGAGTYFVVRDAVEALGNLAAHYRRLHGSVIVAVTGSNGKTTTKDMIHHVLEGGARVMKSQRSFNNYIGVPLTLFGLERSHDFAVIELGANHPGEIRRLAEIASPQIGVLTNIGEAHLAGFGSLEGVARAKGELLERLGETGVAVLNGDDPWCERLKRVVRGRVITFGLGETCDIRAVSVERTESGLAFRTNDNVRVELGLLGMVNVHNALAAIAVGRRLGLRMDAIAGRLGTFGSVSGRMETTEVKGVLFLNDTYNANPSSVRAGLVELAARYGKRRRVAVLGSMLELGEVSESLHRGLWPVLREAAGVFVAVGAEMRWLVEEALAGGMPVEFVRRAENAEAAADILKAILRPGDAVLVKGSHALRMGEVVAKMGAWLDGGGTPPAGAPDGTGGTPAEPGPV